LTQIDLNYLFIPDSIGSQIHHKAAYYLPIETKNGGDRKVFYSIKFEPGETAELAQAKKLAQSKNLTMNFKYHRFQNRKSNWNDADTMRTLYSADFVAEKFIQALILT